MIDPTKIPKAIIQRCLLLKLRFFPNGSVDLQPLHSLAVGLSGFWQSMQLDNAIFYSVDIRFSESLNYAK
ncbi:MAG: hypothetical protein JHC38_08550 [Thiotrichales bacterium]|jgi:hypothetical protein|nr:hypothetical protein [Thiotrichales bacterium]